MTCLTFPANVTGLGVVCRRTNCVQNWYCWWTTALGELRGGTQGKAMKQQQETPTWKHVGEGVEHGLGVQSGGQGLVLGGECGQRILPASRQR